MTRVAFHHLRTACIGFYFNEEECFLNDLVRNRSCTGGILVELVENGPELDLLLLTKLMAKSKAPHRTRQTPEGLSARQCWKIEQNKLTTVGMNPFYWSARSMPSLRSHVPLSF